MNRIFPIAVIFLFNCNTAFATNETGFYQVQHAYLNTLNCSTPGKPTDYASQFLRISLSDDETPIYKVSTCDGDDLDDLNCDGYRNTTTLNVSTNSGVEGYYFSARKGAAKDGTPQCYMTALRRRVIPEKGSYIRYERTDWGIVVDDYNYECTRKTAQLFFNAQSLQCSTHIVVDAVKVKNM